MRWCSETDDGQVLTQDLASAVCRVLPEGYELRLCMENGSAWVELCDQYGDGCALPDPADKSLEAQVNDGLVAASKRANEA